MLAMKEGEAICPWNTGWSWGAKSRTADAIRGSLFLSAEPSQIIRVGTETHYSLTSPVESMLAPWVPKDSKAFIFRNVTISACLLRLLTHSGMRIISGFVIHHHLELDNSPNFYTVKYQRNESWKEGMCLCLSYNLFFPGKKSSPATVIVNSKLYL